MQELRWILLGFGLLLIGGLWLWGRRRSAAAADEVAAVVRAADRYEAMTDGTPTMSAHADDDDAHHVDDPTIEMPVRGFDERQVSGANPPVVTIDDLPDNVEDVVLIDAEVPAATAVMHAEPPRVELRTAPEELPTVTLEVPTLSSEDVVSERRRPKPNPPPVLPAPSPLPISDPLADALVERPKRTTPAEPPSRQQRIVAIRLIAATDKKIDGAELQAAFVAERLTFGRYSIFHRLLEGDRPVYSAASLLEPDSFEPETMASTRFPGISLFAVFPGPLPAPQAFDDLLATARRLADRLGGLLQDYAGSSLTGQRVLSLREELVHFEHLVSVGRSGRPGS